MFWMVHFLLREAGFFPSIWECISSGQLHQLSFGIPRNAVACQRRLVLDLIDSFLSVLS